MPSMTKKGFTLLETLLSLIIISGFFVLTLKREVNVNLDYINFSNDYLTKQADSLVNKSENELDSIYGNYYVHFNECGRVNMAQTINFDNKNVVIHLGNGYLTYE